MPMLETTDGVQLFYRDWCKLEGAARASAETLVFVAGQSLPSDVWSYNIPFFTDLGMRCVAFDRRGHGRSDAPSRGYDIDTLARDVASVLGRLDLRDVTLVGHSLGGAEVVRYLSRYSEPARVARAVLIAPTLPRMLSGEDYPHGFPPSAVHSICAGWRADFARWIDDNKRAFFAPETSNALVDWGARLMDSLPLYIQLEIANTTASLDLREDLARCDRPTLLIHGDLDRSVPIELALDSIARLSNVRFERYRDAAHGVFITHSERVHQDMLEFIRTTARGEAA
ncbi:MAG TPA: alpha/beta hydrolase [Polyangiaceae bacterium]|nr:alpha/beta hydrolase [Polyangiaceae bacterium]